MLDTVTFNINPKYLTVVIQNPFKLSRDIKQQNGMCAQQRLRSAWASAQSDQSCCLHEESLSAQQRLIRLGGCPG